MGVRSSNIATNECGGITQGIASYNVELKITNTAKSRNTICFLDTPGHEAFYAMRARGAQATDITIIIVAADEGVKPQTIEVIQHAKAVNARILVAINKIDKNNADQNAVKQQLVEAGILPEEWGGQTVVIPVSAKKKVGIQDMLENLLLFADLEALTANPFRYAKGIIIEAFLDNNRGAIVTVIVQTGTVRVGDVIQAGNSYGKVRALLSDRGFLIEESGPSTTAILLGLKSVPVAGDVFEVVASEQLVRKRMSLLQNKSLHKLPDSEDNSVTMETDHVMNLILKADVSGSIEAIKAALSQLPQNKITLRYLIASTGAITKSNVELAYASEGIVLGFNTTASGSIKSMAKEKGIEIRLYKVIYDLVEEIRAVMEKKLPPVIDKKLIAVFEGGNTGKVAGCNVIDGRVALSNSCSIFRNKKNIYISEINSIRRVKDRVKEVSTGTECGIDVEGFMDWEVGDLIECYKVIRRKRILEEAKNESLNNQNI